MNAPGLCKGFLPSHLEWAFGIRFAPDGAYTVPYYGVNGDLYREKEFSAEGKAARWLGDPRPQIPYGCQTLAYGGTTAFIAEGESDCWALQTCFPRSPVLAVPGASSWRPEWARLLKPFPLVYASFDADAAGNTLLDSFWPTVPHARRVKLPEGRDTRDVLQLEGEAKYEQLLDKADFIAATTSYILAHNRKDSLRAA